MRINAPQTIYGAIRGASLYTPVSQLGRLGDATVTPTGLLANAESLVSNNPLPVLLLIAALLLKR